MMTMNNFTLELEATTWHYTINGDVHIPVNGRLIKAVSYHIERDTSHADQYAMQIVLAHGDPLIYEGVSKGNWPSFAKRFFEQHMKATGQWWAKG